MSSMNDCCICFTPCETIYQCCGAEVCNNCSVQWNMENPSCAHCRAPQNPHQLCAWSDNLSEKLPMKVTVKLKQNNSLLTGDLIKLAEKSVVIQTTPDEKKVRRFTSITWMKPANAPDSYAISFSMEWCAWWSMQVRHQKLMKEPNTVMKEPKQILHNDRLAILAKKNEEEVEFLRAAAHGAAHDLYRQYVHELGWDEEEEVLDERSISSRWIRRWNEEVNEMNPDLEESEADSIQLHIFNSQNDNRGSILPDSPQEEAIVYRMWVLRYVNWN